MTMITKDESIVTQVAAKIAADIAIGTAAGDIEIALSNFSTAYAYVDNVLMEKHGFVELSEEDKAQARLRAAEMAHTVVTPAEAGYQAPAPVGAVTVAGTQHGPLPAWLASAAAKAGVSRVFDNRDKAMGTKRPWFKEAIPKDQQTEGREPVAFWPPKGAAA